MSYFFFPNSPSFAVMFIKKELPMVFADNDTDRTFDAISERVLTWENSELKNELKLSQAEIQSLPLKLFVCNSMVDTYDMSS